VLLNQFQFPGAPSSLDPPLPHGWIYVYTGGTGRGTLISGPAIASQPGGSIRDRPASSASRRPAPLRAAPRRLRISDTIEAGRGRRATLAKPGARL
jgi:hypothetical protein